MPPPRQSHRRHHCPHRHRSHYRRLHRPPPTPPTPSPPPPTASPPSPSAPPPSPQGDEGDSFYVVTEGQLDAFMEVQGDEPIQSYRPSDTFGELALLYNSAVRDAPRTLHPPPFLSPAPPPPRGAVVRRERHRARAAQPLRPFPIWRRSARRPSRRARTAWSGRSIGDPSAQKLVAHAAPTRLHAPPERRGGLAAASAPRLRPLARTRALRPLRFPPQARW